MADKKISYVKLVDQKEAKWYYTWVKEHMNGFCVHSIYSNYKYISPVDGALFYELDYGMWNSDLLKTFDEAIKVMKKKVETKTKKGYEILEEVTL